MLNKLQQRFQSRSLAILFGETRYRTGKPCKHGHVAERLTSDGVCIRCKRGKSKRSSDPAVRGAARRRQKAAHRLAHPEAHRAARARRVSRWRKAHPELARAKRNAHLARWRAANPGERAARRKRDKLLRDDATSRAIPGWADHAAIAQIYECARFLDVQVDHTVPLRSPIVCGLHVEHNLRPMLPGQNASKGNRYWPDMPT